MAKLSRITTISEKQLSALNTTLLAELEAISKLKVSDAEKSRLQQEAWGRYNDAIKYAGGLAALSTYSQKLQDQELLIQRLASIQKVSNAQTAADAIKQAALDKYLATLGKPIPVAGGVGGSTEGKGIAEVFPVLKGVTQEETTALLAEGDSGLAALMEWYDSAAAAANAAADLLDYQNELAEAAFQKQFGSGSKNTGTVINFNAPITTTSTDEFGRVVQQAIQNEKRFGNNLDYAGAI